MCGIIGKFYFDASKQVIADEIEKMNGTITHRGPDDRGIFTDKNIGLGHTRLSIIDLSPAGHQPMPDETGRFWIVFNGEIYNFLELRKELEKGGVKFKSKTDTETIIYLYKKYGVDCLKRLRGMFAFAIWDKEKRVLFLARDRVGKKPLKYYSDGNVFIFASELKAILKNPEVEKEIDWEAVDEYLTYQYVPHPKTGFKNIFKLEPGHYLLVKQGGEIIKKRYWEIDYSKKLDLGENEWEEAVLKKLKESVKIRLISDVPLGAHLSGGIDSSVIVALMAQEMEEPVKTFSIGFKEDEFNELPYARLVAQKYKTEHQEFIVEPDAVEILKKLTYHYEEPYADSSALPTWYLSELTKKHVTVALNGDGGDENFMGYTRYNAMKLFYQLKVLPLKKQMQFLNQILWKLTGVKTFRKGWRFLDAYNRNPIDFYLNIVRYFGQDDKNLVYSDKLRNKTADSRWRSFLEGKFNESSNFEKNDQILYADINSYLPDDLLVKVDIASMAHALEIRSPFLDHEFMELTAQMPANLKLKGHNKKYLLKKMAYKLLPKECIDRPKQGFGVPLEHWFRGKLENSLKERLLDGKFLEYGFKKDGIEKLIGDHQAKHRNNANQLWALLTLSYWMENYF